MEDRRLVGTPEMIEIQILEPIMYKLMGVKPKMWTRASMVGIKSRTKERSNICRLGI